MRRIRFFFLSISILALGTLASARAGADASAAEESFRYSKFHVDDTVNEDGTEMRKYEIAVTVLREDAINALKQHTVSYSTSAEKVDIAEAYTLKPGGKRVDADRSGFQIEVNGGRKDAPPAFSDQTSLTVVFPDVAVGDTVNLVYSRAVTDPLFPKQFSAIWDFTHDVLYDDVRISYSIPVSLNARYKSWGLTESENKTENERQLLSWTFKNAEVKKTKYTATPVVEIGDRPTVVLSTFPSYKTIAESYGARATPKAAVTDQIKALADQITKGKTAPKEQARALYDWETANLTYAGNCIGIGAVVPRDLDFVLRNKMGDCKDHATLLQALLKAKGIESTQALIGTGNIYKLPEVPLLEIINHVINYIPSLDLYLDATSGMPFGYLPKALYGKPVLLVDGYRDGTTTPKPPMGQESMKIEAKVTIGDDGSADGVTTVFTTNPEGASYSAQISRKSMTAKKWEEAGENALKKSGYQGTVTLEPGTWDDKTMTYTVNIHYHLKDYVHIGTPGAIMPEPPFSPQAIGMQIVRLMQTLDIKDTEKLTHGFLCTDGLIEESYRYTLPKAMSILAVPDSVSASNSVQSYASRYALSGQSLTVSRTMNDTTPGPVCASEINDEYMKVAVKIWPDIKAQIVYK